MLTVDVARVTAVLLVDGWHEVRGGIEVESLAYVRGERELQTAGTGVRWIDPSGEIVTCPLESVLAVRMREAAA